MKAYVLGHEDAVLGFWLAGVEGEALADAAQAVAKLEELRRGGDVGLVLITSDLAREIGSHLDAFRSAYTLPIVLEIPAPGETVQRPSARELLRRAVGASP
jgi:vacuolar-type H+-ATPase subunit F/Vma7